MPYLTRSPQTHVCRLPWFPRERDVWQCGQCEAVYDFALLCEFAGYEWRRR